MISPDSNSPARARPSDAWLYAVVFGALVVAIGMLVEAHRIPTGNSASAPARSGAARYQPPPAPTVRFVEIRRFPAGVPAPRGLAVGADGCLYVAGTVIQMVDQPGNPPKEVLLERPARCIAVDRSDTLYVGINDHVEVYDRQGRRQAQWKPFSPASVVTAICAAGPDVWVADAGRKVVWRCDPAGRIKGRFAEKDDLRNIPGLVIPSPYFDVAMGPDGRLRVANTGRHQIEIYAMDGSLQSAWGHPSIADDGFCGCCNPTDLAILPDGRVVTSEKKLPRVKLYGSDGQFLGMIAGTDCFEPQTAGIDLAVDAQGRIYLLDPVRKEVRVYQEGKRPW